MTGRLVRGFWILVILLSGVPEGVACQRILIVYHSGTGHTARLADAVALGARGVVGSDVRLLPVDSVSHDDVVWADALIVGSPVHSANVSAPIAGFLSSFPFNGEMRDKILRGDGLARSRAEAHSARRPHSKEEPEGAGVDERALIWTGVEPRDGFDGSRKGAAGRPPGEATPGSPPPRPPSLDDG